MSDEPEKKCETVDYEDLEKPKEEENDEEEKVEPLRDLRAFLRKFHFPNAFIDELIENGLTEDIEETLEAYKLRDDEINYICEELDKYYAQGAQDSDSCDCSFQSKTDVSSRETNVDANYLKEHFGNILSAALCEIAMKKPFDPVEYLGHWLLYYRECSEREKKRKEFEEELNEERLKYMPVEVSSIDWGEEEHVCLTSESTIPPCPVEP